MAEPITFDTYPVDLTNTQTIRGFTFNIRLSRADADADWFWSLLPGGPVDTTVVPPDLQSFTVSLNPCRLPAAKVYADAVDAGAVGEPSYAELQEAAVAAMQPVLNAISEYMIPNSPPVTP